MTSKPSKTTPAALRHRERIARTKADIAAAQSAQAAAARRRDYDTARMWLSHVEQLRVQLQTLRTVPINTITI